MTELQTIHQRSNAKDFVDLYFLLQSFTVWDLIEGVRGKFRMEVDPYAIASAYLKAEKFDSLPQMLVPLDLPELKNFYTDLAEKLGKSVVKA